MNSNKIADILKNNNSLLKKYHVKKIGLFGSYARGDEDKSSDIDLLVEFDDNAFGIDYAGYFDAVTSLSNDLHNIFKINIDIVTPDMISPYIAPSVLSEVKYIEGV